MDPMARHHVHHMAERWRVEHAARRMRADEFDRLIFGPLARAIVSIWRKLASVAKRARSPRALPGDRARRPVHC